MSQEGFIPGYGIQLANVRSKLVSACLRQAEHALNFGMHVKAPDKSWDNIVVLAKDLIAADAEWKSYMQRKADSHRNTSSLDAALVSDITPPEKKASFHFYLALGELEEKGQDRTQEFIDVNQAISAFREAFYARRTYACLELLQDKDKDEKE